MEVLTDSANIENHVEDPFSLRAHDAEGSGSKNATSGKSWGTLTTENSIRRLAKTHRRLANASIHSIPDTCAVASTVVGRLCTDAERMHRGFRYIRTGGILR
ncbi:MAG: hypothetical protein ACJAQ8_001374 [Haliea salexigens]|jgi:hypothetical protein